MCKRKHNLFATKRYPVWAQTTTVGHNEHVQAKHAQMPTQHGNLLTFISSHVDVLHTVINSVLVQTLPQRKSALTDSFSRGHDPFAHACKARPPTIVGWTSLSVSLSVIVTVIVIVSGKGHPSQISRIFKGRRGRKPKQRDGNT